MWFRLFFFMWFFWACCAPGARADVGAKIPFPVKSKAAVLMNSVSGQFICSKNPHEQIPPASLTKLMTLFLAYESVDNGYVTLSDEVKISKKAWQTTGSRMFLEVGTSAPLKELLTGIAVVSGNDACVAVAEYIAGVEEVFVEKMNKKSAALGMTNTVFKNSHGLPAGQHTTARDVALLAYHYVKAHPEALRMHRTKKMVFNGITQRNRNGLLWLDCGVDGLKTGWFSDAGYHIVATAYRDGDRFIAVVMGADSEMQRENIALKLLNYGFRNFKTVKVVSAGKPVAQASVWKGICGSLELGLDRPAYITVPREEQGEVILEKDYPEKIFAPVAESEKLGTLRVIYGDDKLQILPLVALNEVGKAGPLKSALHSVLLSFGEPPYVGGIVLMLIIGAGVLGKTVMSRARKNRENMHDLMS